MLAYGFAENEDYTGVKSSTLVNNGAEIDLQDYKMSVEGEDYNECTSSTVVFVGFRWFLLDEPTKNSARCRNFDNEDTTPGVYRKSTPTPYQVR